MGEEWLLWKHRRHWVESGLNTSPNPVNCDRLSDRMGNLCSAVKDFRGIEDDDLGQKGGRVAVDGIW